MLKIGLNPFLDPKKIFKIFFRHLKIFFCRPLKNVKRDFKKCPSGPQNFVKNQISVSYTFLDPKYVQNRWRSIFSSDDLVDSVQFFQKRPLQNNLTSSMRFHVRQNKQVYQTSSGSIYVQIDVSWTVCA